MIKSASKPAKVAVKPGQGKKDSSSSSDSSGTGIEENENFHLRFVLAQTSTSRQGVRVQLGRSAHSSAASSS